MAAASRQRPARKRWYAILAALAVAWPTATALAVDRSASDCAAKPSSVVLDANTRFYPGFQGYLARIAPGGDGFGALRLGTTALHRTCHRQLQTHATGADIWFRFDVTVLDRNDANWVLAAEEPQVAAITVHELLPDGERRIKRNGAEVPAGERDMQLRRAVVGLSPAHDGITRYLVHIASGAAPTVTLSVQSYAKYQAEEVAYLIGLCAFIGFLAAIALYNLNLYFNLGVGAAPFYVLYLAFLILNSATYGGMVFWLTSASWPRLIFDRGVEATGLGAALAMIQYCRLLLRLQPKWPFADNLAKGLMVFLAACFALHLVDPVRMSWPLHLGYLVGTLILFWIAWRFARQGERPARRLTVSFFFLFFGVGAQTLLYYQAPAIEEAFGLDWISSQSVQDAVFYLGIAGEAVFMSMAVLALVADDKRAERTATEEAIASDDRNQRFLAQLTAAIDRHMAEANLDIRHLAEILAMSERTLRRRLHEAAATTPAEFIRSRRLKHAHALLTNNTYGTVAEVAHAVGLAHTGHFAKLYRENFGRSPRQDLNGTTAPPDSERPIGPARVT